MAGFMPIIAVLISILRLSLFLPNCACALVIIHPEVKNWIKYARFEQKNGYINSARGIYERAVEFFGEDNMDEALLIAFAKFEEAQKEVRF